MRPGSSTAGHPATERNVWDCESAYRESTARAPDPMARPVVADFEMRPKRSHFERAGTRMLSTMASVESGTTGVPASLLGLLWFHWYDGCKRTSDCPECRVGPTSRWIQRAIQFSARPRNRSKAPLWIVRGMQPELKAWRDGMDERLGQVRTILKNYIGDLFDQPPTRRSDLSSLLSRGIPSVRAGTTKIP